MTQEVAPPSGIRVLFYLAILVAIVQATVGLLAFGLGGVIGISTAIFWGDAFWGTAAAGTGQLISAALWAAVAFGLRGLKQWAWLVAVIASGFTVLTGIQAFLTGGTGAPFLATLEFAIAAGVLIYLFRSHVVKAFGR